VIYSVYNAIQGLNNQGLVPYLLKYCAYLFIVCIALIWTNLTAHVLSATVTINVIMCLPYAALCKTNFIVCLTLENIEHNKCLHVFYFRNISRNKFFPVCTFLCAALNEFHRVSLLLNCTEP